MKGIVVSGKGEGGKFLSMQEYGEQIFKKYGIKPYPGTLNIKVGRKIFNDIKAAGGDIISGFIKNGREYGDVICFPSRIFDIKCLVMLPQKTSHEDVVEVAADVFIREKYGIEDGDEVEFIFLPLLKKSMKRRTRASPFIGNKHGKITIFYDPPFKNGRRDLCDGEGNEREYGKTLPSMDVASIIFEGEGKEEMEMLMDFVKKFYGRLSPLRRIDYSVISEWQIEVKTKKN